MSKNKRYDAEFKMKVAIEAASEKDGILDIAGKHQIHNRQVYDWKKRLQESAELVFEKRPREENATNKREEELLKKIGQLSMEVDWLKKKLESSGN
jgi:transposase